VNVVSLDHRADGFVTNTQVSSQGKLDIQMPERSLLINKEFSYTVVLSMSQGPGKKGW